MPVYLFPLLSLPKNIKWKWEGLMSKCALCYKEAELEKSHIIPKFMYRSMKKIHLQAIFALHLNQIG